MMSFFKDFGSGNMSPGMHWLPGIGASTVVFIAAEQVILFRVLRPALHSVFSKQKWWDYLKTYKGLFCKDVQKEVQYVALLSMHHLLGGYLMLHGIHYERPEFFAAGLIVELSDDIHDSMLMLFRKWPFKSDDGEKMDMKITTLMLVHHLAGISCIAPCLVNGFHLDVHVQKLSAALLGAGGAGLGVLTVSRTRNRTIPAHTRQDAVLWSICWVFMTYTRWYVFPKEMLAFFRNEYHNLPPVCKASLLCFITMISLFNVPLYADATEQTIARVRLAWKMTMRNKLN